MGMFDWVNYECDCPKCGAKVTGFQSKDSTCELNDLKPTEVSNFYSSCDECHVWIEFNRIVQPTENYTMVVKSRFHELISQEDVCITA